MSEADIVEKEIEAIAIEGKEIEAPDIIIEAPVKRGRGRPKGSKNTPKATTDVPSITLSAEPEDAEEPAPPPPKPRAPRAPRPKRVQQPAPPPSPRPVTPERRVDLPRPIDLLMYSLQEMQQKRVADKRMLYRNMIR